MKTGKVVLGTLAGLAIGALAGILFAPEKGSTTRQQIKDKSDDYADDLKAKFNEYRNSFTEKFKSAKKDAQNLVENGKSEYDDAKRVVKNAAENFKHDNVNIPHATS